MYVINIQSISDIITNSSSETFCRISSERELLQIYEFLKEIFPQWGTYEVDPMVDLRRNDGETVEKEDVESGDYSNLHVAIEVPYGMEGLGKLLEYGLDPTLRDNVPGATFNIEFDDNY